MMQQAPSDVTNCEKEEMSDIHDDLFPELPNSPACSSNIPSNMCYIGSGTVTQVFCIPAEEHHFDSNNTFYKKEFELICQTIMEDTSTDITMSVSKDQTVTFFISGKPDSVPEAREKILTHFQTQEMKSTKVSVEVPKVQHKYIIGQNNSGIAEILDKTGVSVEMPPSNSCTDTIVLRGPHTNLGTALAMLLEKANIVETEIVDAPEWIHKHIISGDAFKKLTQDLPQVSMEFMDCKIKIEGPPEEVRQVKEYLETVTADLINKFAYAALSVKPEYSERIFEENAASVNRLVKQTKVMIDVIKHDIYNIIRIEGNKAGVKQAKQELEEMINKFKNKIQKDLTIDYQNYCSIIGPKGERIREIQEKFNHVHITVPDVSVKLQGPEEDVNKCHKYIFELLNEVTEPSYILEVPICRQYYEHIIGKGGANISKIRQETGTKMYLPSEGGNDEVIVITGTREKVEEARDLIMKIQNEQVTIHAPKEEDTDNSKQQLTEVTNKNQLRGYMTKVRAKPQHHRFLFGQNGVNTEIATIHAPKEEDTDNSKQQLTEVTNKNQLRGYMTKVRAKPQHHRFLFGQNGVNIEILREITGCDIIMPTTNDDYPELITIIGKQEDAVKAKAKLEAVIKELEIVVYDEIMVDQKRHRHFLSNRGEVLSRIADDCGGVSISFPETGDISNRVRLIGSRQCIKAAKLRIGKIVKELANTVTEHVNIQSKFYNFLTGFQKKLIRAITDECGGVTIKFSSVKSKNIKVNICGQREDVEHAKQQLIDLADNYESQMMYFMTEMRATPEQIKFLIEKCDADINKLKKSTKCKVLIPTTNDDDTTELITIIGYRKSALKARAKLEAIIGITGHIDDEMMVDQKYHKHFLGKQCNVLKEITNACGGISIFFPQPSEMSNRVVLKGSRECIDAAKQNINEIVKELKNVDDEIMDNQKYHRHFVSKQGDVPKHVANNCDRVKTVVPLTSDASNTVVLKDSRDSIDAGKQRNNETVEDLINIPFKCYHEICGLKQQFIHELAKTCHVCVEMPISIGEYIHPIHLSTIRVTGTPQNVKNAKLAVENKIKEICAEIQDQEEPCEILGNLPVDGETTEKKNFFDYRVHSHLIGRRGRNICKIMKKYSVEIKFPLGSAVYAVRQYLFYESLVRLNENSSILPSTRASLSEYILLLRWFIDTHCPPEDSCPYVLALESDNVSENDLDINIVIFRGQECNVWNAVAHLENLEEKYLQVVEDFDRCNPIEDTEDTGLHTSYQSGCNSEQPFESESESNNSAKSNSCKKT